MATKKKAAAKKAVAKKTEVKELRYSVTIEGNKFKLNSLRKIFQALQEAKLAPARAHDWNERKAIFEKLTEQGKIDIKYLLPSKAKVKVAKEAKVKKAVAPKKVAAKKAAVKKAAAKKAPAKEVSAEPAAGGALAKAKEQAIAKLPLEQTKLAEMIEKYTAEQAGADLTKAQKTAIEAQEKKIKNLSVLANG